MVTLLTIVHITVCLFLILVVLLQAGKGGGMGIAFGGAGSQTVFGSSGAGNFLTRLTSITAAIFLLTSLALAHYSSRQDSKRLQELATQKAAEKKSEDEKATKLKADMEKIRSAATVGKDAGAAATTPQTSPPDPSRTAPATPLQLKLPGGGPAGTGTAPTRIPTAPPAPPASNIPPRPAAVRRRPTPAAPVATPPARESAPAPSTQPPAPETAPAAPPPAAE